MRAVLTAAAAAAVAVYPSEELGAQSHARHGNDVEARDSAVAAFVAAARAGTARYRELSVAIADGYRRVGIELPSLGEHWVQLGRIAVRRIVASEPPVLIYVRVNGSPQLVGVAYTAHLRPGEPYPDFPAGQGAWHDHNGSVDEEVLPVSHGATSRPGGDIRLGVMHAWLWSENPRGLWTAENWALPFVRAGLRHDSTGVPASAALAMASGSDEYYARVITELGALAEHEPAGTRAVVARAAAEVTALVAEAKSRGHLTSAELIRLDEIWRAMWEDITATVGEGAGARLTTVRALWRD